MATPEDVRAALTPAVLRDALAMIARRMGGPRCAYEGQSAEDLLSDAVEATLVGTRPWRRGKALVLHLFDAAADRARWRRRMAGRMTPLGPMLADPIEDDHDERGEVARAPAARELAIGLASAWPADDDDFRARLVAAAGADPELRELAWALQCGIRGEPALATFMAISVRDVRTRYMRLRRAGRRALAATLERIAS